MRRTSLGLVVFLVVLSCAAAGLVQPPPPRQPLRPVPASGGPTQDRPAASDGASGFFRTGQDADLMLSGIDFNNTGGALLFNHPTGITNDGKRFLLADRWNNRVLVWKTLPDGNKLPDFVLGQKDFIANNSGVGRDGLNWPGNVSISTDGDRVAIADTNNDRILIWNEFPQHNATPADIVLELPGLGPDRREFPSPLGGEGPGVRGRGTEGERFSDNPSPQPSGRRDSEASPPRREAVERGREDGLQRREGGPRGGMRLGWPWGVWTDGRKLAVVATHGSSVLSWNNFPTRDNQPPDLVLTPRNAGTPRNISSDGTFLMLSDHNYRDGNRPATMFWKSFPTSPTQEPDWVWYEWLKGCVTGEQKLLLAGPPSIYLWNEWRTSTDRDADVVLRPLRYANGDGPDAVFAGGRLYACNYNGNNVLVWNSPPTRDDQPPDFAIGSPDVQTNTLETNFFITNGVPATDGKSLFVSSDFDRKLYVWRSLPDESGANPDVVHRLPDAPWDNALHGETLVLAGKRTVSVWRRLPLHGEPPDTVFNDRIGSVPLEELTGVALDERYLYLADRRADRIYVWEGIPRPDSEPKFSLDVPRPGHLSSDGQYLAVAPFEGATVLIYRISDFGSATPPATLGGPGRFNLPHQCLMANGHLFVADTSFNRVHVWHRAEDAFAGRPADALLGADGSHDVNPEIGRNKLFMPGALAFDGSHLWVSEFKFSGRLLRFSPRSNESAERPPADTSPTRQRGTADNSAPLSRQPEGDTTRKHPFHENVKVTFTDTHMIVESDGIPNHPHGEFPNADNPNRILKQNYRFKIPLHPRLADKPTPLPMGPIGVAINGIPLYNPYNAQRRDAVSGPFAEVFDSCCGHADPLGRYHYHKYPVCLKSPFRDEPGQHSPIIGYAFDGFAVHGPNGPAGKSPDDLDECNGHSDPERGYHYHVTSKFPYILGAYRGVVELSNFDRRGPGRRGRPDDAPAPPQGSRLDSRAEQPTGASNLAMMWSRGHAQGRGPVKLTTFPLRVEDIDNICPMGLMVHGHVTPSDHLGIAPRDPRAAPDHYDVLAPADGFIVQVQRAPQGNPDPGVQGRSTGEYRVVIEHSGTFWSYCMLINKLAPSILEAVGGEPAAGQPIALRMPVKGGQVIGKVGGGHGLDFAVVNTEVTLNGFILPERFRDRDPWKPHTVDPFDYVDEPLKSQLLALNRRKAEPPGGKIDYDIDGRLIGNWYKENTGGYASTRGRLDYWVGHLAIVYHHIDPTKITVSIGDFAGRPRQFWVKGNMPDPAAISKATGAVKYELVYASIGSAGQRFEDIPTGVQGVLLVQLVEDRKLRAEAFPGKTADEVTGFTDAAVIHER